MLKIGLTGGIGSGKSTIAKVFETMGYPVYICDRRASELMNEDEGIRSRLTALFGETVYLDDRHLDKKRLADIIFRDTTALERVNGIVHPAVMADFDRWSQAQKAEFVFCESAILFEAGLSSAFDAVVAVSAAPDTRIRRVMARDNTAREKVIERLNNQMADEAKCQKADYVITNNDDDRILPQIQHIINQLKQRT